jgi:hypothetical protein
VKKDGPPSRIALARKLTTELRFTKAVHGTHFVDDLIRSFDLHPNSQRDKRGPNTGFAYFETSNLENISLETSTSEFPVVFSRTVSGPSSYTERWANEESSSA